MVALARRAREGGSWLVRISLAQTGRWLVGRGQVPEAELKDVPKEFTPRRAGALVDDERHAGRSAAPSRAGACASPRRRRAGPGLGAARLQRARAAARAASRPGARPSRDWRGWRCGAWRSSSPSLCSPASSRSLPRASGKPVSASARAALRSPSCVRTISSSTSRRRVQPAGTSSFSCAARAPGARSGARRCDGWPIAATAPWRWTMPPFGFSERPAANDYTMATQGRRLADLLTRFDRAGVTLVGHSFGARATVESVMLAPEQIRALVPVDAALGLHAPDGSALPDAADPPGAISTALALRAGPPSPGGWAAHQSHDDAPAPAAAHQPQGSGDSGDGRDAAASARRRRQHDRARRVAPMVRPSGSAGAQRPDRVLSDSPGSRAGRLGIHRHGHAASAGTSRRVPPCLARACACSRTPATSPPSNHPPSSTRRCSSSWRR